MKKETGGSAFPHTLTYMDENYNKVTDSFSGMSLLDYFAVNVSSEDIENLRYRNLSRSAEESILGEKYINTHESKIEQQIYEMKWQMKLNSKIRYMYANAMLIGRAE